MLFKILYICFMFLSRRQRRKSSPGYAFYWLQDSSCGNKSGTRLILICVSYTGSFLTFNKHCAIENLLC